jgi:hypothetical protein
VRWPTKHTVFPYPGNPYWSGSFGTIDLLVPTSLDQLLFILQTLLTFLQKRATFMRRSTVLCLPLQLVFPALPPVFLYLSRDPWKEMETSRIWSDVNAIKLFFFSPPQFWENKLGHFGHRDRTRASTLLFSAFEYVKSLLIMGPNNT